jgi:HAD superfamily hydrolase (TIGR01450 family)
MGSPITVDELLDRYDVFFLDAYGVLVAAGGPLPGAAAFLERLERAGKASLIVSNDASRSPATSATRYRGFGLPVHADRILTSGLLLRDHFESAGLVGARCIVLGTEDSRDYVREAGGVPVTFTDDSASVVVVADDDGYPFLESVNDVATVLLRRLARGEQTSLVLPNPDVVFPSGPDTFGITSGAIAAALEAVLRIRDVSGTHAFVPLGKPHRPMFEAAAGRFPGVDRRRMVMMGDQLGTDILGAQRFGIDSVLLETGVARLAQLASSEVRPTWTMTGLA